ncbi:MAG: diguanylate cyclase, partial [Clostridium sp.]
YNLRKGNVEDAKKYAIEYQNYLKQYEREGEGTSDSAYIYLAECYIVSKEFEKVPELLEKIEVAYNRINSTALYATLNNLKGTYYEAIGDENIALKYFEKSLEEYESINYDYYSYNLSKKIIKLIRHHNLDVDVKYYVDKYLQMEEKGSGTKVIGEVANNLINTIDELNDVKNLKNNEQKELLLSVNSIVKKINAIFIITIIALVGILYKLKVVINEKENKEEILKEMVNTDYLTKASSKQYTYLKINDYIMKNKEFYVTMIDIDHFKKINDTYGHLFGDEVLVVLVRLIKETVKENGFVGRYGGEEFIIIIDNISLNVNDVINEISQKIQEIKWRYPELKVTISGGTIKSNNKEVDELILMVDELLYESKKVRNKITSTVK